MDRLLSWALSLPDSSIYVALAVLAGLENLFPPVPADTIIALGAYLASRGALEWPLVFASTWFGTAATATLVYAVARRYGRPFFSGRLGRRLLSPRHLDTIRNLYRRFGLWGILISRVLPVWRAVVPPSAGIAHMSAWRTLPAIYIGSAIWYAVLTWVVYRLGGTLDEGVRLVTGLNRWLSVPAILAGIGAAWWWWRTHRRDRANRP